MKKNVFTKSAAIHQLKSIIYAQGFSVATDGPLQLYGPVFTAEEGDHIKIGEAVLSAFAQCKTGIFHHIEWRDGPKKSEMLEATKCKTWNALMKASKRIGAKLEDESVELMPKRFGGTSGSDRGYHNLKDKAIISSANPEELGRNVIKALELCE